MKRFFSILLITLSVTFLKAQGNLQFNQVLTYGGGIPGQIVFQSWSINSSDVWIVPSNKVWKVENWTSSNTFGLVINNTLFISNSDRILWLKSGDEVRFNYRGNCGGASNCFVGNEQYFISIIEFNVVP